jgi:ornithine cyclodeaminase
MLVINNKDLSSILTLDITRQLVSEAMQLASNDQAVMPLRWGMPLPQGGLLGMMPGYLNGGDSLPASQGIKIVNILPANGPRTVSSHSGSLLLFDTRDGRPLAMLDAGEVTAMRTAAATAMATAKLARKNCTQLCILGTGEQALAHIPALLRVRDFDRITVWGRSSDRFAELKPTLQEAAAGVPVSMCEDVRTAIAEADVVCALTASPAPIIQAGMLSPGMHINLVGACTPDKQEISNDCLPGTECYVDSIASAWDQAGELVTAREQGLIDNSFIKGEIGTMLAAGAFDRKEQAITIYRSLGVIAQDLIVAQYVYQQALAQGLGQAVDFP